MENTCIFITTTTDRMAVMGREENKKKSDENKIKRRKKNIQHKRIKTISNYFCFLSKKG